MPNSIVRDERTYRRGLVMGLTLAEIMLLVLFALLLIFGWMVKEGEGNAALVVALKPLLPPAVQDGTATPNVITDAVTELRTSAQTGRAVRKGLGPKAGTSPKDLNSVVQTALEQIELGKAAEAALGPNTVGSKTTASAHEALTVAKSTFERARLERGDGSARIWLERLIKNQVNGPSGAGTVFPSCVPEIDGRAPYVYDVTLYPDGLITKDNTLPQMVRWNHETSNIQFGTKVSAGTFESMTASLFEWSRANQCRFFVRVFDATLPDQKALYKSRLQTVEDHFYKFLAGDGTQ